MFKRERLKPEHLLTAEITADLIIESYNLMGCDALSIGAYDLSLGVDYLVQKSVQAKFPFLSANLFDTHGNLLFAPYVLKQVGDVRVGIVGFIDDRLKMDKIPQSDKIMVKDPFTIAQSMVPEVRQKGAEYVVVLTNMAGRSLRKLAQLDVPIDLIVGSDNRNQISLPIVVGDSFITHLDRGGKCVGHLDVTFLGSDRDESNSLLQVRGTRVGNTVYLNRFVQLRLALEDHPVVGPRVADVLKKISETQRDQISTSGVAGNGGCGKEYVGVATCAGCHPERHRGWLQTGHARAYEALVKKNRQYDEECLGCHVLAYECNGGEVDLKSIDGFANVQCESCHGPGDLHAQSRGEQPMVQKPRETSCVRCHTPERSSDIDLSSRIGIICAEKP